MIELWTSRLLCGWLIVASANVALAEPIQAEKTFTLKVLPLLKEKCLGCHGADETDLQGDFSVLTREHLLRGGESETAGIVPGKPDEGTFFEAISWAGLEMPPKENDRLTEAQVAVMRSWIEAGAPWPDETAQAKYREENRQQRVNEDGMIVTTSGGTSEEWTHRRYQPDDLWAFMDVRSKDEVLPSDVDEDTAIDFFIDRKLDEAKLASAPKASARALIRRATFDLTGLPPTPEEVKQFSTAYAEDPTSAWADLIDRLLQSPRYGEHWARHWFDVTRYSDTGGMANDYERSNMWRYRDYVIRAFNNDKPYDQFIVEQLAGDELADASVAKRNNGSQEAIAEARHSGDYTAEESEWLVATGFLRMGPWDNAMIEKEEARQIYLDDLVNITGQTFLATTMRCCKCHDHKFDPLPTRDYYRMYAAFAATHMAERPVPFLPDESRQRFDDGKAHVQRMLDFAVQEKTRLINRREAAAKAWFDEHELPYKNEKTRKELPDDEKPPRHVGLSVTEQGQLKVREQDEWIWKRRLERYEPMAQSVFNAGSATLAWNGARMLRLPKRNQLKVTAKKQETKNQETLVNYILQGGALTARGDEVGPGVLSATSVAANPEMEDPYRVTNAVSGRRSELARWIANPGNPLTTRAIVNRIWQSHFGTGIAANPNNFGGKGAKPSHPELLDFLASDFVENGWRMKRMHRTIMMSDAYQRQSTPANTEAIALEDPNNTRLSFYPRRRLSSEELRDGILAVTGELRHSDGGLPVMPEINMEVALQPRMIQFSLAPAYQPSRTPDERNRRSIYAYQVRGQADPFGELFNQPNPNESCELRETAAVTPQVFALLNSDLITDRSIAMAIRLEAEGKSFDERLNRAYQLLFARTPSSSETDRLRAYYTDMVEYHSQTEVKNTSYPTEITRSLVEEFSGDVFEYKEILPIFEDYTPDLKPADVDASARALADVCLLLFNSNEFIYLD